MSRTAKSSELRVKRAELEAKIKSEVEKDSLTPEQRTAVNAMIADSDNLKAQYDLIERSDETEKELRESVKKVSASQPGSVTETSVLSNDGAERKAQTKKAFRDFLKNGKDGMAPESRAILDSEKRTYAPLQVANPGAGYFVPQGFSYEFDEALKQTGGMIEACRMYPTDSGKAGELMADVTCQVEGLSKLEAMLKELAPKAAKTAIRRSVRAGLEIFQEAIEEKAPRDTGRLAASVTITTSATGGDSDDATGAIMGIVGPTKFYSIFAEYGTVHKAAQPFVYPAYEENKERVVDTFKENLAEELEGLGQ